LKKSRGKFWTVGTAALGCSIFVLFQNCGKAGFEGGDALSSASLSGELDPKLSALPFPYDISVNQIAHMSCPLNVSNPSAVTPYFSWKVGAYANPTDVPTASMNIQESGLTVNPKFITEFQKVTKGYTQIARDEALKNVLRKYPSLLGAQLQLSFRQSNNIRTSLMQMPAGGNSPVTNFLSSLTSEEAVDMIRADTTKIFDYFQLVPDFYNRAIEARLTVPSAYGYNHTALLANYDAGYLTVGFTQHAGETQELVGEAGQDLYAYGKAFKVIFSATNPHQGTTYYPARDSLVGINEYDLATATTTGASWDCSYRFKIVRNADRYNSFYRANNFARINGQCPGAVATGTYCASPVDQAFGISNVYFPNSTCPVNRTFRTGTYCIEQYASVCPPEPYSANTGSANLYERTDGLYNPSYPDRPKILHALRRFLPSNDWDVNVSRRCIVPKSDDNSCYSTTPIVYDEYFSSLIDADASMGRYIGCGVDVAGVGGTYACASYLTLCLRR